MSNLSRQEPTPAQVRSHYESSTDNAEGMARVVASLDAMGDSITTAQLAPLDQFHAKGLGAVKELAVLAGIKHEMRVLDAGSGLGGPARFLAETYGCHVTGIDLTPSFVHLARLLTERTHLTEKVDFQVGSIMDLPFPDASFDIVWTQHVVMNIRDRARVYGEFCRVLKPGGNLVFHDIYLTDDKTEPTFPLGWASSPETSFLLTRAETEQALMTAGFEEGRWIEDTAKTLAIFDAQLETLQTSAPALNLGTFLGPRARELGRNIATNMREGRLLVAMGIYARRAK